jgi:predicted small secreted protein
MIRTSSIILPVVLICLPLAGCSSDGDMFSNDAGNSTVRLAAADVQVGGHSVNNATISTGSGSSSLFTVALADPADRSRMQSVQMDYSEHSSMGMMGRHLSVECYDDGTHGDAVAGDGMYSYMDVDGHVGPHYSSCVSGTYTYTFHGTDTLGRHTNSVECRVTVQ